MKKRNIGICIITTTLLMGGHAKAYRTYPS